MILRSRPSSELPRAGALALAALLCLVGPYGGLWAQDAQQLSIPSPILIIDQDRLYAESRSGSERLEALEQEAQILASENQRIEQELIAEERALTEQRPGLPADEFRALADAFDQKVQRIRTEQDEKARALTRARDEAQSAFFQEVAGVILEIVREKGAVVVLDRRDVFLSAERIDITNEAIRRINEEAEASGDN